jgi:hypothetical protein
LTDNCAHLASLPCLNTIFSTAAFEINFKG